MPDDILSVIYKLINNNWQTGNVNGAQPSIKVGHFDPQDPNPYQVNVKNVPSEDATGTSGVHGISPGGGNNQLFRGLVFVDVTADAVSGVMDPDRATDLFVKEITRIIRANMNSVAGYDYVSFLGFNRAPPEKGERPLRVTRSCRIGYQWREES